jgi:hypothetical protein
MLKAWKMFAAKLEVSSPCNAAEVLSTTLWWSTQFYASNFGFSHQQAAKLMRVGLTHVCQLWNPTLQRLYTGDELKIIFKICHHPNVGRISSCLDPIAYGPPT